MDFKATPRLVLSLTASYNWYEMFAHNRVTTLTTGAVQAAGASLVNIRSAAANVGTGGGGINKQTTGYTLIPKFEYTWRAFTFDGAYSTSASKNSYGTNRNSVAGNTQVNALGGLTVEATRPGITSSAWDVRQTGGLDWANLFNYKNPRITDDVRAVYNEVNNLTVNGRWAAPFRLPTFFKFGYKRQERILNTDRTGGLSNYNYNGPGGGTTGSFADFPSAFVFSPSALGVSFRSISGGGAPVYANRQAIGQAFATSPQNFTNTLTADNYFSAAFADKKRYLEVIPSAYLLGNVRIAAWQIQGGLRWERTETSSQEFDPLSPTQVAPPSSRSTQAPVAPRRFPAWITSISVVRKPPAAAPTTICFQASPRSIVSPTACSPISATGIPSPAPTSTTSAGFTPTTTSPRKSGSPIRISNPKPRSASPPVSATIFLARAA